MKTLKLKLFTTAAAMLLAVSQAQAANFSFTGNFTYDNDVQFFTFTVGAPSTVTLRSWSYAGGVNAAGATIARGGFDPILAVYNSAGTILGFNDDGGPSLVPTDITGQAWDTYFSVSLPAGTYTASVMQYDNFTVGGIGGNVSSGFVRDGQPNFTSALVGQPGYFWDVSGSHRDNHWAFDILNVEDAVVPEPSTYLAGALLALVFGVQGFRTLRHRKTA